VHQVCYIAIVQTAENERSDRFSNRQSGVCVHALMGAIRKMATGIFPSYFLGVNVCLAERNVKIGERHSQKKSAYGWENVIKTADEKVVHLK